ncbi:MAG TPA: PH domain-containing protein [Caldilineae bacterium]|nr:PH domain-containing protein [Caldilineae bacterium]
MDLPVQLQGDEQIIALLRRHPVYIILQIIGIIVLAMLLVSAFTWMQSQVVALRSVMDILIIATAVIALGAVGFIYYRYRNDLWLVTNQRLVDSIKTSPFSHEVASADLLNVQDIAVSKRGIFPTLFNFGDVSCQTAGSTGVFVLRGVPNPNGVLELIDQTRDRARERALKMGAIMGT